MSANEQIPLACDLTAIEAAEREQHILTAKALFATVEAVSELPDGYSFRLPLDNLILRSAVEWIANERLCCPFFTFSLRVDEAIWLSLTGSEDVKAFIRAEFGSLLSDGVAVALK